MIEFHKLVIDAQLPDLNSEINNAKRSWKAYARTKAKFTSSIHWQCKSQLKGVKIIKPVATVFIWYLPNRRKDPDNVYFSQKYIFDGLVSAGVLAGDGFRHTTGGVLHLPLLDKERPRVEIYLLPGELIFSDKIGIFVSKVLL